MAIEIQYGNGVVVLPKKAAEVALTAEKSDLAVLIALLSDASLCQGYDPKGSVQELARASACTEDEVRAAIAFWRGAGVLSISADKKKREQVANSVKQSELDPAKQSTPAPEASGAVLLKKTDELPKYTTAELGNLLEARPETEALLQECQNLFGKLFSTHEVNIVLGLTDYLGLDTEYVLILVTHYCQYCKNLDKRPSVRGLEKLAISLYDRGITDMGALQEELLREEELQRTERKLRTLFGIGARALTAKEKRMFSDWLHTYGFDMEMITLAFEVGADASTDVNVSYVNSILSRWHAEKICTPADVQAEKEAHDAKKAKGKATEQGGSFDTDDFFDAAMRKSLGDNYDKIMHKE